jgi:hypothetical protein
LAHTPIVGVQNHYWEYMTIQFSEELESVKYVNFYYEDASTYREKALGWILLALSQKGVEIKKVVLEIFNSIPLLQLYRQEDSYFWQNRKELLEICDIIAKKDLTQQACPLIEKYEEYLSKKTIKRSNSSDIRKLIDKQ